MDTKAVAGELLESLAARGDADFARRVRRYLPDGIRAHGVGNAHAAKMAGDFFRERGDLPADTRLMHDKDVYVRKGCGWLLKVTGQVHPAEVEEFLREWRPAMKRDTFRYALEALDEPTRASVMALDGKAED